MHIHIKICSRNILEVYEYDIMKLEYKDMIRLPSNNLRMIRIDKSNLSLCKNGAFGIKSMQGFLDKYPQLALGYAFNLDCNETMVGYLWVLFKGSSDNRFRVRDAQAMLSAVNVYPEYRGNGYVGQMINQVFDALNSSGYALNELRLGCRSNDKSALRGYQKVGFLTQYKKRYVRFLKLNILYPRV